MHPEGIFDVTQDPQQSIPAFGERRLKMACRFRTNQRQPDLSIDPEETADIVIPLDHPVFRRNHSRF